MIAKIQLGLGTPGKLWTGSREFFPGTDYSKTPCEVQEGLNNKLCQVELAEWWSQNGSTTRKLRLLEDLGARPDIEQALEVPKLYVSAGGVGSSLPLLVDGDVRSDVAVWNWSGRVGGFAVLDPIHILSGYVRSEDLPPTREWFIWIQTYAGSTLNEFVLVQLGEDGWIHPRHRLSCHRRWQAVLSPPERRAAEEAQKGVAEDSDPKEICLEPEAD